MFKNLFNSVGLLIKSYLTILRFVSEKRYLPKRKILLNFRGKIIHKRDENGKLLCNGCEICTQVCPCKDLIKIKRIPLNGSKISVIYETDNSKCVFCGNCVEYCPEKALEFTPEYIFAAKEKKDFKTEIKDR